MKANYRRLLGSIGLSLAIGLLPGTGAAATQTSDPLESVNRGVFAFNDAADRWVLRPLASTYSGLTPSFVQKGIGNALRNLRDVNYAINAAFQGRFSDAATNAARFAVNSTVGLAGTMDIAKTGGLESAYADFGQTLAVAGVPAGPFIMIPILGPSTVRDGTGFAVDAAALSVPSHIESADARAVIWGTAIVHRRAQLLDVDGLLSGDRYIFMRDAYLQRRNSVLGESSDLGLDSFGDFEDGSDFEDEEL